MSFEIVRTIKVDEKAGKVYIRSASNNVFPKDWDLWECKPLSDILQSKGREALDLEILRQYEEGNFQARRKGNRYTQALAILRNMPEYREFDWRNADWEGTHKKRATREFDELLKKALMTPLPKEKYIIAMFHGYRYFYLKITRARGHWVTEKKKATIFAFEREAENVKLGYVNSQRWEVKKYESI